MAGGAPDTAAALLRRALGEPPEDADRPQVVFELGNAEYEIADPSATRHLREAIETTADPLIRARAVTALAWTNHPDARSQRAQLPTTRVPRPRSASTTGNSNYNWRAPDSVRCCSTPTCPPDSKTRLPGSPICRRSPGRSAYSVVRRAARARRWPISAAGDLAEQAAAHPALVSEGGHPLWRTNVTICLLEAERYEVAEHILSRAIRHAERMGSPQWLARALWLRGLVRHRRGDLRAAEVDGRAAVDIQGPNADYTKVPGLVVVIDALADEGRADEGEALLSERGIDAELTPTLFSVLPLLARGRMYASVGSLGRARDDLLDALRRIEASRGMFPWANDARVALVPVLLSLDDQAGARAVADKRRSPRR